MDTITRRRFLVASGVTGAAALAAGGAAVAWENLAHRATTEPRALGNGILVIVTLYGGNDGVNTVIPYADGAYHSARPELAYSPDEVIKLDGQLGLNPSMTGMNGLWKQGQLAIVRGTGYPNPDHSHFRSMDIWQTASPGSAVPTGWIGRWLDHTGDDPIRAIAIGSVLPPLAVGAKSTAASLPVGAYVPMDAATASAITALGTSDRTDDPAQLLARAADRAERTVAGTFDSLLSTKSAAGSTDGSATSSGKGGSNPLGAQLDVVSTAIKANVPTKVWSVSLGGFDTHADEKTTQQGLWKTVDAAITGFFAGLSGHPAGQDVVMMVHSEFGRRVQANASQGTDHGTAAPMFVIGSKVNGGFHGDEPSLTDLDNGDLKATVDFRAVYGEMLTGVLGSDPHAVLDTVPAPLGLLHA